MNLPAFNAGPNRLVAAATLGAALWLSACTSQPLVSQYAAPPVNCCASIADLAWTTLPPGQAAEFHLTPSSPTLEIDGRRTHVVGLAIPDGMRPSAVVVTTYLSSSYLPKATVVAPRLVFYGAGFVRIGDADTWDLRDDHGFWRSSLSQRVPVPAGTRYVVLMPGEAPNGSPVLRSESGIPYYLPPAALGDVAVRLFGETER